MFMGGSGPLGEPNCPRFSVRLAAPRRRCGRFVGRAPSSSGDIQGSTMIATVENLLDRLAASPAMTNAGGADAIDAILATACDLLGCDSALIAKYGDEAWRVSHLRDDLFEIATGDLLPLDALAVGTPGALVMAEDVPLDPLECR